jgi:hypothetical protein
LGHEPRAATTHEGYLFALQRHHFLDGCREIGYLPPDLGLGGYFAIGMGFSGKCGHGLKVESFLP